MLFLKCRLYLSLMDKITTVSSHFSSIDTFNLTDALSGKLGQNRASGNCPQISATNDIDAVKVWLSRFSDTKTTFDSYRKEAERLLLWSTMQRHKPLSSLTHEDFIAYQDFIADPQPANRWVMQHRKRSRTDPNWRPFSGPLSPTSQRQAIIILNSLFTWLVNAGYLAGNPLSLSRNRQRKAKPRVTRFLDDALWQAVKKTISLLPQDNSRSCAHYQRTRWLFSLLYITGMRVSEVTDNNMGGFFCRQDKQQQRWWLEITGKGNKTRIVPATNELMTELSSYRQSLGLNKLPIEGEKTPLLLPIGGKHKPMTRSAVHLILKQIFKRTADRLKDEDPSASFYIEKLALASAHWLRHTAGSNMATTNMDVRHVRDNLGHESLMTTNQYLHSEDNQRHEDTESHHKLNWSQLSTRNEYK